VTIDPCDPNVTLTAPNVYRPTGFDPKTFKGWIYGVKKMSAPPSKKPLFVHLYIDPWIHLYIFFLIFFYKFGQNKFKGCKAPPKLLQKRLRFYHVIFLGVLAGCFWGGLTPAYYFFLINFLKIIYI
jgi:fatty acid desaturase